MSRFVSISEQELERIKQMKIYMVVKHELRNQNFNLKGNVFETETIDDDVGMFWLDIIALLLSEKSSILSTQSDEVHKKLSEQQILQWFQTLRSSVLFMNSMLVYTQKIEQRDKTLLNNDKQIENLRSSNKELESKNEELSAVAREAINWAKLTNINEVNFSSNFKI